MSVKVSASLFIHCLTRVANVIFFLFLLCASFFFCVPAVGKQSPAKEKREKIRVLRSRVLYGYEDSCTRDQDSVQRCSYQCFAGHVWIRRGKTDILTDSLVFNKTQQKVYAYGNVRIKDGDSLRLFSDYLYYDGKDKKLLMQQNVRAVYKRQRLYCQELLYDRNTKTAQYFTGGHIRSDSMDIYSRKAMYFVDEERVVLRQNVRVQDTAFRLRTDSLLYLRKEKKIMFLAPAQMYQDSTIVLAHKGYYRLDTGQFHLVDTAVMFDKTMIYLADTIDYNKRTGRGFARCNFASYDTAKRVSLNAHSVVFRTKPRYFRAADRPFVIYTKSDSAGVSKAADSMFVSADTLILYTTNLHQIDSITRVTQPLHSGARDRFFSPALFAESERTQPMSLGIPERDTTNPLSVLPPFRQITDTCPPPILEEQAGMPTSAQVPAMPDSSTATRNRVDSFAPIQNIIAYRRVKMYNDSVQVVSDSFSYTGHDSVFHLYQRPFLWHGGRTQFDADTIHALTREQKLVRVIGKGNSRVIRHKKLSFYDQVYSTDFILYLSDDTLQKSLSIDSVRSLVYVGKKQDDTKLSLVNVVESDSLITYYKKNNLDRVVYRSNIRGTTYPLTQFDHSKRFLKDFVWLMDDTIRPRSKRDIIDSTRYAHPRILTVHDYHALHPKHAAKPSRSATQNAVHGPFADPARTHSRHGDSIFVIPHAVQPVTDSVSVRRRVIDSVFISPPFRPLTDTQSYPLQPRI